MGATPRYPGMYADPIDAFLSRRGDSVLAIITGIEGQSFGPLRAIMAVFGDKQRVGTLSAGCIERDIALRALDACRCGGPTAIREIFNFLGCIGGDLEDYLERAAEMEEPI